MKPLVIANWKMNPTTLEGAKLLFEAVKKEVKNIKKVEIVICPPFVYLPILKTEIKRPSFAISFGGQSCFWEEIGAFTGEISPLMLKDLGVEYVILGHSERRKLGETDEIINKKIKAALKVKLKPILCVDKISQIKKDLRSVIIAYEPLLAIGTGKPCSIDKAKKMRIAIKKKVNKNIPILYGGSINSENAQDYIKKAGFQGLLVGGASLKAKEFIKLVKNLEG